MTPNKFESVISLSQGYKQESYSQVQTQLYIMSGIVSNIIGLYVLLFCPFHSLVIMPPVFFFIGFSFIALGIGFSMQNDDSYDDQNDPNNPHYTSVPTDEPDEKSDCESQESFELVE